MTDEKFSAAPRRPPRQQDELPTQRRMDLAASVQAVTEKALFGSDIGILAAGNCFLRKENRNPALKLDDKNALELA